ncbi:MAG: hypothetical protein GX638_18205 [Crenarchaeota archaeon]|mgnify:CR=1 FL=1|nr:hypothetical protein [Thermoproteota archaeon]
MVDKKDILRWSRKYDKDQGWWVQKEFELGAKFRRLRFFSCEDLAQVVEWKYKDASEEKKKRLLDVIIQNDEAAVNRISGQVFNVQGNEDGYRMNCLTMLNGVSPVIASVVLAFFDPKQYGVFDVHVWRALLGNEPANLFTIQNYLKLLTAIRKTASKHNLDARTIEKAFYKKHLDEKK